VQKIRVTGKPPEDDVFNKIIEDTLSVRIEYTIIGQEDVPQNIQFLLT